MASFGLAVGHPRGNRRPSRAREVFVASFGPAVGRHRCDRWTSRARDVVVASFRLATRHPRRDHRPSRGGETAADSLEMAAGRASPLDCQPSRVIGRRPWLLCGWQRGVPVGSPAVPREGGGWQWLLLGWSRGIPYGSLAVPRKGDGHGFQRWQGAVGGLSRRGVGGQIPARDVWGTGGVEARVRGDPPSLHPVRCLPPKGVLRGQEIGAAVLRRGCGGGKGVMPLSRTKGRHILGGVERERHSGGQG